MLKYIVRSEVGNGEADLGLGWYIGIYLTCRFSCLLDADAKYLYDRVLENKNPPYLRPVEAGFAFFCFPNSGQSSVVKCSGWCGILDEKQEESTLIKFVSPLALPFQNLRPEQVLTKAQKPHTHLL